VICSTSQIGVRNDETQVQEMPTLHEAGQVVSVSCGTDLGPGLHVPGMQGTSIGFSIMNMYLIYDMRAVAAIGPADAICLDTADSLEEARDAAKLQGEGAIYRYRITRNNELVDETWIEDVYATEKPRVFDPGC